MPWRRFLSAAAVAAILLSAHSAHAWLPSPGTYARTGDGDVTGLLRVYRGEAGVAYFHAAAPGLQAAGILRDAGEAARAESGWAEAFPGVGREDAWASLRPLSAHGRRGEGLDPSGLAGALTPREGGAELSGEPHALSGFYAMRDAGDPVVTEPMAAYAVRRWGFPEIPAARGASSWTFDPLPAGMHEGIGRMRPAMQVTLRDGEGKTLAVFLVANDLTSVYVTQPGAPRRIGGASR